MDDEGVRAPHDGGVGSYGLVLPVQSNQLINDPLELPLSSVFPVMYEVLRTSEIQEGK